MGMGMSGGLDCFVGIWSLLGLGIDGIGLTGIYGFYCLVKLFSSFQDMWV
jgi:hypothetical protein